ncbi:MAG: type I methionyl aminopeptidase [Candidatus Latescibacterota bacterium]|nr:MAG: type I methionyl aminopeptidase [Candidatus Latescibacterota bacterium]
MRRAGEIVAGCHDLASKLIRVGATTGEIDAAVEGYIRSQGAVPSFKGYMDYPAAACISVNEEVVHGIPGSRVIRDGDIVGFDIGALWQGYHADAARTFAVGNISEEARRLMQVTREALQAGIEQARVGNRLSDISHAVQEHAEAAGFSVVRNLVGHGIGQNLHEKPQVPNFGPPGRGPRLRAGMVLALEPMVNVGVPDVYTRKDRWTIVTLDGKLSAHYEQTVAITDNGPEVLTGPLHTGFDGETIG